MTTKTSNCISLTTKKKVLMVAMIQDPKTVTIRMSDSNNPLINYFESMIKSYTNRRQKQRIGDMVFSWVQRSWWWMMPLQCARWLAVQLSPNVLKSNIVQLSTKAGVAIKSRGRQGVGGGWEAREVGAGRSCTERGPCIARIPKGKGKG